MIKTVLVGLWTSGVALAAAYLALMLSAAPHEKAADGEAEKTVEFIKSDTMSVPVIREGKVMGYVVAELSFAVHRPAEAEGAGPAPYLVDAAYRTIYENISADFGRLKPQDLKEMSEKIKAEANARLGEDMVQDVLVSSINFVGRDEIRTNWTNQNH